MYVHNADLALSYNVWKWSDKREKSCSILERLYQKVETVNGRKMLFKTGVL